MKKELQRIIDETPQGVLKDTLINYLIDKPDNRTDLEKLQQRETLAITKDMLIGGIYKYKHSGDTYRITDVCINTSAIKDGEFSVIYQSEKFDKLRFCKNHNEFIKLFEEVNE